jgi:transposase InsO family protein
VLDAFTKVAVGWSIDRHQDTDMVNDAVNMAAKERLRGKAVILHSDYAEVSVMPMNLRLACVA